MTAAKDNKEESIAPDSIAALRAAAKKNAPRAATLFKRACDCGLSEACARLAPSAKWTAP